MREAAVSWVERDGEVLVVWNRRYRGWTLPGGLVEDGETPPQGMVRELREETGLHVVSAPVIYDAPAELVADGPKNRGSHVWVFLCDQAYGIASPVEGPIMWVTRDEFLALCPFKRFYERMFTKLGWSVAEEVKSTAIVKHPGPVAYVTARLEGLLYVSERDTPASSLLTPIANLLKDFGDKRVSIVLASEEILQDRTVDVADPLPPLPDSFFEPTSDDERYSEARALVAHIVESSGPVLEKMMMGALGALVAEIIDKKVHITRGDPTDNE